ncbi:DUF1127 domain-containing protein [Sulfitobacter albidus]|uniref:DUF1127 domain-containing protein n=1 Tax=Sulfitobacter albidus TaxID=2829501 RepID=UPI0020C8945E|nr:DUF1127 domain-containing protein [Sulfitobacter albidus]
MKTLIQSRRFHLSLRFPGLAALIRLQRSRAALARLDAAALRDIGITPDEARAEARRPIWDAPAHWRG